MLIYIDNFSFSCYTETEPIKIKNGEILMAQITVNFDRRLGRIKPLHGVGQPPFTGTNYSFFHYLTEANIPFSRLHDVGGAYGGNLYVDIPNLFRG